MVLSKVEFAVENIEDVDSLRRTLSDIPEITKVNILKDNRIILETTLPSSETIDIIQKHSNSRAVLQGFGDGEAGVVILNNENVQGVIRLATDLNNDGCIFDGTIDGLLPGKHLLNVHTCGDLSQGCESTGDILNSAGSIEADDSGRANFKFTAPDIQIHAIIGRSVVITSTDGKKVSCGVVARSAGLFGNSKKICLCDGVSVWDERNVPIAGQGRRKENNSN